MTMVITGRRRAGYARGDGEDRPADTAISLVFRKAFCSWLCPNGTVSEWLSQGGRELFRRNVQLSRWLDIPLRGVKYLIFGFAVLTMSADEIAGFLASPYGMIADVKLLNVFREVGTTAALVVESFSF